ncbi:MAG TPA: hypothetical protein DIW30_04865 [Bacteroidales bacterium]|nr:hypothetical protein [Bacteroidales bacterium]
MRYCRSVYGIVVVMGLCCLSSCSTQKNTALTRAYHATTTRYNIYYNGNLAFEEGLKAIDKANQDDFSRLIPLYPVSNHEAAQAASSQMDRTIEKCRKCIKLHSIKKKPKPDPKKRNDPKYQAFLNQREFNKYIADAWLLLGEAEFHKADFLGSIGTFSYIIREYDYDKNMVAQCQLWMARAYAEIGWMYEAEELLQKVNQDNLDRKKAWLYSAVTADIKLKSAQYKEAVPFLKLAVKEERKTQQTRYYYLLGQLYELQGDKTAASAMYKKVTNKNPNADMDFSARVKRMELSGDIIGLKKMAGQYKYREKLDYIYGSIGDIYLNKKDTSEALAWYQAAIDTIQQASLKKADILVRTADLYYDKGNYSSAQPCYAEAVNILSSEAPGYKRCAKRAEVLGELVAQQNVVTLQDSLQYLSTLPEEQQLEIVRQVIADLEKAEQEALARAEQEERNARQGGLQGVNTQNMLGGGGGNAEWYFYNPQLLRTGKQTFVQTWGNRTLEDNWRRISKVSLSSFEETDKDDSDSVQSDTVNASAVKETVDQKDPQFYLRQIPKTEEAIAASDMQIADALYAMILIYQNKLEDEVLAEETYREFRHRFPEDTRLLELYYRQYLSKLRTDDLLSAERYKALILAEFPDSEQAMIVNDPDYFERLSKMSQEQDSIYRVTYEAYKQGSFAAVKNNKTYVEKNYPFSPLMPKFLFLNAVAVAKTDGQEAFIEALRNMVNRYPTSDVGAMAKDMLAMMNQGMESQMGGSVNTLAQQRSATMALEESDSLSSAGFSAERRETSSVLLCFKADEPLLNKLLYQVALFNFSQFMIKDFDLKSFPVFRRSGLAAVQILGFESLDEAEWYCSLLANDTDLQTFFLKNKVQTVSITDSNEKLLYNPFTVEDYQEFLKMQTALN